MIDLHCHILPECPSHELSANDWENAMSIARLALEDGISHINWTPEFHPGAIVDHALADKSLILNDFKTRLNEAGFPLELSLGADFHIEMTQEYIAAQEISSVTNSRYIQISVSQIYSPSYFESNIRQLLSLGYIPILSHPERCSWVNEKYHALRGLIDDGAWIQITADSFTGYFGRKAQYWAERFISEGLVHVVASEAYSADKRPPVLSEAKAVLASRLSKEEVNKITRHRPLLILENELCSDLDLPPGVNSSWRQEGISASI